MSKLRSVPCQYKYKYYLATDADGVPHLVLGVQLPLVAHRDRLLTETLQEILDHDQDEDDKDGEDGDHDEAGEDNSGPICAHRNLLFAFFLRQILILFPFFPTASTFKK